MSQSTNFNSVINTGLPSDAPPNIKNQEVKFVYEAMIMAINNVVRNVERFSGFTTKDKSLWSLLEPTDTLFKQNLGRLYVIAGEDLVYGQMVNLYNDTGILKARRAQATAGTVRKAHGYVNVANGFLTGFSGEVIIGQGIVPIGGITPGQDLYLSAGTPGSVTNVAPVGAGQLEQFIGYGIATDLLCVDIASGPYNQH